MKKKSRKNWQARLVICIFLIGICIPVYKLFTLQILKFDEYQKIVIDQLTLETTVNPSRGKIYDTNGNLLASNATVWLIFISPDHIINAMNEAEEDAMKKAEGKLNKSQIEEMRPVYYDITTNDGVSKKVKMNELIATRLSEILNIDYDFVIDRAARKGRRYEVMATEVGKEKADEVRALIAKYDLTDQIHLTASSKRFYTYDSLASHVIGFTNSDGVGIYGLESMYNNVLEGTSGKYITAQDARSNDLPFEFETYVEAKDGYNIVTTLDMYIQYELENQLALTLEESGATDRVTGIVMDVNTGAILGMATAPGFDLNDPYRLDYLSTEKIKKAGLAEGTEDYTKAYYNNLYYMWNNKAVTNLYEPGSTFKIITTAMALDEGLVTPNEHFYCSGSMKIDGYPKPIGCHRRIGHGDVTFAEGLQQSCNPTLMTIAARLGRETFYRYFLSFGYGGSLTGIDLPGEVKSYYHDFKDFSNVSLAVYSFGQTFKTTPIQQLTAISSIANGGYIVTPHLLKEIVDDEGNVIETYKTEIKRQVVSTETCETITDILEDGVSGNGGAKNAYVKGYRVAAKTGTSQKRDKLNEYGEDIYRVGSCVAYAPADDPQIAVIIVVDEPMKGNVYGSVVAAPYVSKLLGFILPYMGFEPQYTAEEMRNIEISIGNYVGATVETANADLGWRGINYVIVGDGDTVTLQVPKSGSTISKETGKLILYTGDAQPQNTVKVPDLIGKTAETANRMLINSGLNVKINGAKGDGATVISQSPAAGEIVSEATVVTIEFRHLNLSD